MAVTANSTPAPSATTDSDPRTLPKRLPIGIEFVMLMDLRERVQRRMIELADQIDPAHRHAFAAGGMSFDGAA